MKAWRRNRKGFTIVELLIVIVVIAILAAISIVAYNGIQNRANNMAQLAEIKSWEEAFIMYRSENGEWPSAMVPAGQNGANLTYYCLGTNFPPHNITGEPACRNAGGPNSYPQSRSTSGSPNLIQQLNSQITISGKPKVLSGVAGPWAAIYDQPDRTLELNQIFIGSNGSECPSGFRDNPNTSSYNGLIYCQSRIKQ